MFEAAGSSCDHIGLEHRVLKWWQQVGAFDKLRQQNAAGEPWSFLDGPITANNPMGVHHAWGRTLKDCYQRYHAMLGRQLRYQNGFDCQGLWVEVEVEKEMGYQTKADILQAGLEDFINRCKERVRKYSRVQTEQSIRLGYWMDWSDSYYTMSDENNYTIWAFLKKCHQRGLVYKGLDAMPWCPRCETGISEQERREGYRAVEDTAVFLRLPLRGRPNEYLLVWTTTPWTLPANVAAAVHPQQVYVKARQGEAAYWLAESLAGVLKEKGSFTIEQKVAGGRMIGWEYDGPFDELEAVRGTFAGAGYLHRVIGWEEVSAADGTGIVHIAPGCGKEDFDLGQAEKLPVLMPIDESGVYHGGYGFLTGRPAGQVAEQVLANLREKGLYYKKETYRHDYPHCWRCGTPLLFRAVDEWYINMSWRAEIMEVVSHIRWIPEWGREQELNWLENMHDWMISKKRFWGLALPIFECACGWFDVIGGYEELQKRAAAGWDAFEGHSPHRPWVDAVRIKCQKCGKMAARIPDVGNPWLDAGIVPYSTVRYNADRDYWKRWVPADLVLECFPGQFRNWFYALLAMSTMMEGIAPFKTLLGHALVRDEQGQEMHKSAGNAIWFDDAAEKMGADVMRWIFCGHNPTNNLNFGYHVGDQVRRRVFGTWWNVYAFFVNYARLDGFDPARPPAPYEQRQDIDRWVLSKLQVLTRTANQALADYDVAALVQAADDFIERLSNWYVRRNRRRFWRPKNESDQDKLAAYQTLYRVLVDLCKLLAPVTPFICEEMYQNLVRSHDKNAPESVHHCAYPQFDAAILSEELVREMDQVVDVVSAVLSLRESKQIRVRQPLSALEALAHDDSTINVLNKYEEVIRGELNIKKPLKIGHITTPREVDYKIILNMKNIGPEFGPEAKNIKARVDSLSAAERIEMGKAYFSVRSYSLKSGEKTWELQPRTHFSASENLPANILHGTAPGVELYLDTKITPELFREGLARDIVRHIQRLRKDIGLEIQNHIRVTWQTDGSDLRAAIAEHQEYIRRETLSDEMAPAASLDGDNVREIALDAGKIRVQIVKTT